jgi:hypothetical protein
VQSFENPHGHYAKGPARSRIINNRVTKPNTHEQNDSLYRPGRPQRFYRSCHRACQGSTEVRHYGIIGGTLDAVDKLVKKLSQPNIELRLVYEAGPCGFVIARHLKSKGIHCDLVSPSLIPKKASDRVKTDRRDADQLARLYRAGELTAIRIPDQEDDIRECERAGGTSHAKGSRSSGEGVHPHNRQRRSRWPVVRNSIQ